MAGQGSTRVQLCGGFAVEIEGRQLATVVRGRQPRLLFAYLVLHRGRPVRRDELVGALWPEKPPASPDNALNTLVSRLRKGLGEGVIAGRSELTLNLPTNAWIDIEAAFDEIQRAERALERSDWQAAGSAAELTLSIADRGFLPEVESPWVEEERRRLEELRVRALECLAACGLGLGGSRLSETERAARTLIAGAPYRETGYRYLMQALAERGRVAEALQVFDECRQLLQEELGAPPGAGLRSLHERLLSQHGMGPQSEREDPLAVGSATVTVLFTDLVGSTEMDAGRIEELRRVHFRLLRDAVAAQGGRKVKEVDAGLIALFKSAQNGVDCAVQLQQGAELHNRRHPERALSVRAALHCGESVRTDGEQHSSTAVVMAQCLCEHAQPGQILASAPVRSLAASEQRFRDLGPLEMPDGAKPLATLQVPWEPARQRPFALPPVLSPRDRDVFVGREADLDRLWRLYERASSGTPQIVLLRGEPGIGKTRLATELALRAHVEGAVVLYGRCDEEPLLPHQPFVEALRHYVVACPLAQLAGQVGQVGQNIGELRRLVPELAERLPNLADPLASDPDGERYRLFDAVSALLYEAAVAKPVVLVLDDLHWADRPSLLLLAHLARYPRQAPLLVIGTYRESELEPRHALLETLADLSREHGFERHPLGSLDMTAVASLVRAHAPREEPELNQMIFEQTEGNPFFVVEMLRHLAESGAAKGTQGEGPSDLRPAGVGIPEGVKSVIGRRIARLGQSTQGVLSVASVSGRHFEFAVLERLGELDEDELVEALEQALRARVIEEVAGPVGHYTFSHALIRETIYGDLTATRRALLHRRVAASLEEAHAENLEPYLAELAHHFAQAGAAGDLEKAIGYGARAGDRAVAQLAYEHAAAHYRRAVSLIDAVELQRGLVQRCDLVIAQGEAERLGGDPAYRETLLEGARLAQQLGDAERLARAALANNRGFFSASAGVDRERVSMLEAALEAHGDSDTPTRASLLAQLAVELVADPDWPSRAKLSDDALAMARRIGDPRTLSRTLNYRFAALWGPRTLPERLANARESNHLADQLQDPVLAYYATCFGSHAAMEAGDLALADRLLERAGELAEQLSQPIIHWYLAVSRAKRSSISDSPHETDKLIHAAVDLGQNAGQLDAIAWFTNQLLVTRFLEGTLGSDENLLNLAEIGPWHETAGEPTGGRSVPLLVEAMNMLTLCEADRTDDARGRFDEFMRDGLADLPHDWAALAIPALTSVVCAHLGDVRRAEELYAMLKPHGGQFVDSGPSWLGATNHHLALLATTLGRLDEADACFADAANAYDALGAHPWLARARLDWARTLSSRATRRDAHHAEKLLGQTLAAGRELGLETVERNAATFLEELGHLHRGATPRPALGNGRGKPDRP